MTEAPQSYPDIVEARRLEAALYEAECYGIGATSDTNQRVILQAATAYYANHSVSVAQAPTMAIAEAYDKGYSDGAIAQANEAAQARPDRKPDAWEWRACIGGRWGAWLYLDQPIERFSARNAFNLDNGTYEIRPLYALPSTEQPCHGPDDAFCMVCNPPVLPGHDETMANLNALTIRSKPRCTCAAIVNPNIPHARSCPLSSTSRECDPMVAPCDDAEFGMKP